MSYRPVLIALLLALAVPEVASAGSSTEIIVKRDAGLSAAERADIRADADVRLVETLSLPRTEVVAAEPGDVADALRDLNAEPDVVYAERNRKRTIAALSDDENYGELWAIPLIDADDAWLLQDTAVPSRDVTGADQVVAVVDSGIDRTHPDLANQIDSEKDFVDGDLVATDGDGHGTHVSGTIAAERNNGQGVAGVAPGAEITALRALDDSGSGWDSDIANAFTWAGNHNVKIVNASLAGEGASQTLRTAIHNASNTLFVVAAGNGGRDGIGDDNDKTPTYPCSTPEPNVLCVGASDHVDDITSFSNYGARAVDVFAPGLWIASTVPVALAGPGFDQDSWDFGSDPYDYMHGTSMAAPHVSAVAALVLQASPAPLTPKQIKEILLASAAPDPAFTKSVSRGRIDADAAVRLALAGPPTTPDADGDGWVDRADACPNAANNTSDGCYLDDDWDTTPDGTDNCLGVANTDQGDIDGDGDGDACDADLDGDGVPNVSDSCRATPGVAAHRGCPAPALPPVAPPTQNPPADADGDGIADATDACPGESAAAKNGCPLAEIASLSARTKRRAAAVTVSTTRLAMVSITVERRKGDRWARVARRTEASFLNRATLKVSRLQRGTYRVRVSISSSAGNGTSVSKTFRVR